MEETIGRSLKSAASGFVFAKLGHLDRFLILAATAVAATVLLGTALTETKPGKYIA